MSSMRSPSDEGGEEGLPSTSGGGGGSCEGGPSWEGVGQGEGGEGEGRSESRAWVMSSTRSPRDEGGEEGVTPGTDGWRWGAPEGGVAARMLPTSKASSASGHGSWARLGLHAESAAASYSSPTSSASASLRLRFFSLSLPFPLPFPFPFPLGLDFSLALLFSSSVR